MTTYAKFLLLFFGIPLALLWATNYRLLWRYRRTIALAVVATFIFGTPWDMLSVVTRLWWYDVEPKLGWLYVLPIEEYVFTLIYPLAMTSLVLVLRQRLLRERGAR